MLARRQHGAEGASVLSPLGAARVEPDASHATPHPLPRPAQKKENVSSLPQVKNPGENLLGLLGGAIKRIGDVYKRAGPSAPDAALAL